MLYQGTANYSSSALSAKSRFLPIPVRIEQIQIPAPNELQFCFSDGTEQTVSWKDRSRSESWTAEMREKARQKKWRQS